MSSHPPTRLIGLGAALIACASLGLFVMRANDAPAPEPAAQAPEPETERPIRRGGEADCPPEQPGVEALPLGAPATSRGASSRTQWERFDQRLVMFHRAFEPQEASDKAGEDVTRVRSKRKEGNAYRIGMALLNDKPIAEGETVVARAMLRAASRDSDAKPVTIEMVLQNQLQGYRRLKRADVTLTDSLQPYEIAFRASKDYCVGELNFALHLATGEHEIDVGVGEMSASTLPGDGSRERRLKRE